MVWGLVHAPGEMYLINDLLWKWVGDKNSIFWECFSYIYIIYERKFQKKKIKTEQLTYLMYL